MEKITSLSSASFIFPSFHRFLPVWIRPPISPFVQISRNALTSTACLMHSICSNFSYPLSPDAVSMKNVRKSLLTTSNCCTHSAKVPSMQTIRSKLKASSCVFINWDKRSTISSRHRRPNNTAPSCGINTQTMHL